MTDDAIVAAAQECPDPRERAAFLDRACADADQRRRVERLLGAPATTHTVDRPLPDPDGTRTLGAPSGADETRALDGPPRPSRADDFRAFLQPTERADALGRVAHYEVLDVVGRGGFGVVLRAFDTRLHRTVALKVLAPHLAASDPARARFVREARAAAAVRDDHVVSIHAVAGDDEPVPYLVMELVAGETLQQKLDRAGALPPAEAARVGAQIARGLAAAHAKGLIHRDIKPGNVLIEDGTGRAKLTDFGLARAADDVTLSVSGSVAGTPMYMSPEQTRGEALDRRSDLFGLGTVLFVLCTGRPPFRGESTFAVMRGVAEAPAPAARAENPTVPQWLSDVIARLHEKKPGARFQSALEVAELLERNLREPPADGPAPAGAPAPGKRRGWAFAGEVALLVAGVVGTVAVLLTRDRASPPVEDATPLVAEPPAPDPDEGWARFTPGQELPGWGKVIDPNGDSRVLTKDGRVRIVVPAKDRELNVSLKTSSAPCVIREVRGDFRARVRVHAFAPVGHRTPAPAPSERITLADVLDLRAENVENVFEGVPLAGRYPVGRDGTVHLHPAYGAPVRVYGLTPAEAGAAIQHRVREHAPKAEVSVALAPARVGVPTGPPADRVEPGDVLQLRGEKLFGPNRHIELFWVRRDGAVDLGPTLGGALKVAGLTPAEAGAAVQAHVRKVVPGAFVTVSLAPALDLPLYTSGELVVWQDETYVARVERAGKFNRVGDREVRHDYMSFGGPDTIPEEFWRARPDAPSYLEIERRGPVIRLRTSADGVRWSEPVELRPQALADVLRLGVAATSQNAGGEFRVEFDRFEVVELTPKS